MMHFVSGYVNIFLLGIIFLLARHDMTSALYQIPAVIAVIIGWAAIFKSRERAPKNPAC